MTRHPLLNALSLFRMGSLVPIPWQTVYPGVLAVIDDTPDQLVIYLAVPCEAGFPGRRAFIEASRHLPRDRRVVACKSLHPSVDGLLRRLGFTPAREYIAGYGQIVDCWVRETVR